MTNHTPTEDIPYEVDSFAMEDLPEVPVESEDRTVTDEAIQSILQYLDDAIAEHNSFDSIILPGNAKPEDKIAAYDEMAIHKGLSMHLRNVKNIIINRVREA